MVIVLFSAAVVVAFEELSMRLDMMTMWVLLWIFMEKALRSLQFAVKVWRPKRLSVSMGMGAARCILVIVRRN
jgi:hypothetical protein